MFGSVTDTTNRGTFFSLRTVSDRSNFTVKHWVCVWVSVLMLVVPRLSVEAVDRVTVPARGLRYLRRTTRVSGIPTVVHAVFVDLCDSRIEIRATAPGEGRQTVAAWARSVGATVAVNGDYFDMRTFEPLGPAMGAGHWWPHTRREHRDALLTAAPGGQIAVIAAPDTDASTTWDDASSQIPVATTEVVAARERVLVAGVVRESPVIVHDGARHPRTAVGLSADRHTLVLVVVDGRGENSGGATTRELGEILRSLGAAEALKLDGGGSSTLFLAGRGVVNSPSDGHPRAVATHLGIVLRPAPANAPSRCLSH
jgi:hypothetical protein